MMRALVLSRRQALRQIGGTGLGVWAASSMPAHAAVFMDIEHAQLLLLPQATVFSLIPLALNASQSDAVASASQTRMPRGFNPVCWRGQTDGKTMGWVLSDRVIGKYDVIDYAAGFNVEGVVTGLEVLAYRESHGAEIRNLAWRQQFVRRKGPGQLRFGDDIRNISGATLSCQHVTEGMQRLSAVAQLLSNNNLR